MYTYTYTILYYTILYHTIVYYTILYHTLLYSTLLCHNSYYSIFEPGLPTALVTGSPGLLLRRRSKLGFLSLRFVRVILVQWLLCIVQILR